jgi:hypothetical protein
MPRRFASGSWTWFAHGFGPAVLTVLLAACAPPAALQTDLPPTALPPTTAPTVATTFTSIPTEPPTPTAAPSATPAPADLAISPATLAQLRQLWSIEEPGNPNAQSYCQDTACWLRSRFGGRAFSPDGETLAIGVCTVDPTENTTNPRHYRYNCDGPAEVRLYDSASGDLVQTLSVGDFPISLAFHPEAAILAVGMAQRSIELWDLAAAQKIGTLLHSTTRTGADQLAFSPDGELLISSGDSRLQLWQWELGLPAGIIENVVDFSLNPAGGTLATLFWSERGDYAEARFYPLDDLARFRAFRLDWRKSPWSVRYTPDGSQLIGLGLYGLEIVDPESGKIVAEANVEDLLQPGGQRGFFSVWPDLTADGRLLILASVEGEDGDYADGPGLWDPNTAGASVALRPYAAEEDEARMLSFSIFKSPNPDLAPGDHFLAVRDTLGVLRLWAIDPTASAEGVTCLGTCDS